MFKWDDGISSRDCVACAIKLLEGTIQSRSEELMSLRSYKIYYEKTTEPVKLDLGCKTSFMTTEGWNCSLLPMVRECASVWLFQPLSVALQT